jgi:hypothetical protein
MTNTPTPSQTPTPSPTPASTDTPAFHLPLEAGTRFPELKESISETNLEELKVLANLELDLGENDTIWNIAISPSNEYLAVGTKNGKIHLWDVRSLSHMSTLAAHDGGVWGMAFLPDSSTLASGSESIKLWDIHTGAQLNQISTGPVAGLAVSPDGKTIAVGTDGWRNPKKGALIYSLENSSLIRSIEARNHALTRYLEFSGDGTWIVLSATNDKFGIYDLKKGEWSQKILLHGGENNTIFYQADLSSDNQYIAIQVSTTSGDAQAGGAWNEGTLIWDVPSQQISANLPDATRPQFSPAGDLLLARDPAKHVSAWKMGDVSKIKQIDELKEFALSPDGKLMVTFSSPLIHILGIYP